MSNSDVNSNFRPQSHEEYFGQLVSGLIIYIKESPNPEVAACLANCIASVALKLRLNYENTSGYRK